MESCVLHSSDKSILPNNIKIILHCDTYVHKYKHINNWIGKTGYPWMLMFSLCIYFVFLQIWCTYLKVN